MQPPEQSTINDKDTKKESDSQSVQDDDNDSQPDVPQPESELDVPEQEAIGDNVSVADRNNTTQYSTAEEDEESFTNPMGVERKATTGTESGTTSQGGGFQSCNAVDLLIDLNPDNTGSAIQNAITGQDNDYRPSPGSNSRSSFSTRQVY